MDSSTQPTVPLLGALLIAEGLITQEQLNSCLLLQQQDYPNLLIGEILLRCGYISMDDLERIATHQRELREALLATLESHGPPSVNLRALLVTERACAVLKQHLHSQGVMVDSVVHLPDHTPFTYDLTLIDPHQIVCLQHAPPAESIVSLLPDELADASAPARIPKPLLQLLDRYIEQAHANAQQRQALEQRRRLEFELQTLATLVRGVSEARTVQEALLKLMMIIRDMIAVEAGTLFRLDRTDRRLVFEIVLGPYQAELNQRRLPIEKGIAGWVARHGESLLIPDTSQDSRFDPSFDRQTGFTTRSMICVPLEALGQTHGVLQLINKLEGGFTERDLMLLRITAAIGGLVLLLDTLAPTAAPDWLGSIV